MNESTATTHSLGDPSIEIDVVLKELDHANEPLTAIQLRKKLTGPFKLPVKKLGQLLEEQTHGGSLHRYAPKAGGKNPRYWSRGIEEYARAQILTYTADRPQTKSKLLQKLKTRLIGVGQPQQSKLLSDLITQLLEEEKLYRLPPFIGGVTSRYSTKPPDPNEYLDNAVAKIAQRLGIDAEKILGSRRSQTAVEAIESNNLQNDQSENLLARMVQVKLAAAQGGLLPLNELWLSLQKEGWDKVSFDRTVLSLADKYRVSLHRHNFPASLSERERSELVSDELGNYYVGITLR